MMALTGCKVSFLFFFSWFYKALLWSLGKHGLGVRRILARLRQVYLSLFSRHRSHLHITGCGNQRHPFHDPSANPSFYW